MPPDPVPWHFSRSSAASSMLSTQLRRRCEDSSGYEVCKGCAMLLRHPPIGSFWRQYPVARCRCPRNGKPWTKECRDPRGPQATGRAGAAQPRRVPCAMRMIDGSITAASSMNSPISWWAGADGSTSGLLVLRTGLRRISSQQAQMGTTKENVARSGERPLRGDAPVALQPPRPCRRHISDSLAGRLVASRKSSRRRSGRAFRGLGRLHCGCEGPRQVPADKGAAGTCRPPSMTTLTHPLRTSRVPTMAV